MTKNIKCRCQSKTTHWDGDSFAYKATSINHLWLRLNSTACCRMCMKQRQNGLENLCKFNFWGLIYRTLPPRLLLQSCCYFFLLLFFFLFLFFFGRCTPNITFYLRDLCAMWVSSLAVNGFTMERAFEGHYERRRTHALYKYHSLCLVSLGMHVLGGTRFRVLIENEWVCICEKPENIRGVGGERSVEMTWIIAYEVSI